MTPYYQRDGLTIYHSDAREVLPSLAYDFILTDPPYGIAYDTAEKKHGHKLNYGPIAGDSTPYDPAPLLNGTPAIIWGANCFASRLPDSPGWLAWVKTAVGATASGVLSDEARGALLGYTGRQKGVTLRKSDLEMAWTNFIRRPQVFHLLWIGAKFDCLEGRGRWHPTQKPVLLMSWCLSLAPKGITTVVDPYMGSGSTLIAARLGGLTAIGVEIDEKYCEAAARRLEREQGRLFPEEEWRSSGEISRREGTSCDVKG